MRDTWKLASAAGFFVAILAIATPGLADTLSLDSNSVTSVNPASLLNPGLSTQLSAAAIGLVAGDELNGLSAGSDAAYGTHIVYFSVDRTSTGVSGGFYDPYNYNVYTQALLNQQAGDIYVTTNSAGVASQPVGDNMIETHQLFLGMKPAIIWPQNNTSGVQDNLDGLSFEEFDLNNDQVADVNVYFSMAAGSTTLSANGWSSADILVYNPNSLVLSVFATATSLGLQTLDDIDAIALLDLDRDGLWSSGDRVLFSLAPGSPTLLANNWSAADILTLGYGETLTVKYTAASLGLEFTDNVDALEIQLIPEPGTFAALLLGGIFLAGRRRKAARIQ